MSINLLLDTEHERRPNLFEAIINSIDNFTYERPGGANISRQSGAKSGCCLPRVNICVKHISSDDSEWSVIKRNGRSEVNLGAILDTARKSQFQTRNVLATEVVGSFHPDPERT